MAIPSDRYRRVQLKTISIGRCIGLACLLLLFHAPAQDARLALPQIRGDRSAELILTGPSNRFQRVDVSTNLAGWVPLDLITTLGENLAQTIVDTNAMAHAKRFYRVREVPAGPKLLGLSPTRGAAGEVVEIYGQFTHSNLMQQTEVRFGGVVAELISATALRLQVRVPSGVVSCLVTIQTPEGTSRSPQPFSVTRSIPFQIVPPSGFNPSAFEAVNSLMQTPAPGPSGFLPVRSGLPLVTIASPPGDGEGPVLMAISAGVETNLVLGVESTAVALVFLAPVFVASDSGYAAQFLEIVRADAQVQALRATLADLFNSSTDPYTNSVLHRAFADAIWSVATNQQAQALSSALRAKARPWRVQALTAIPYAADLEYVNVNNTDSDGRPLLANQREVGAGVGPRFPWLNSVDWNVRIQEIDVELAFPNGRDDFNRDWRENLVLKDYPATGGYEQERNVAAELITERLNPVKFGVAKAIEVVSGLFGQLTGLAPDDTLRFPDRNGLYLVRAIGPGFYSSEDRSFALSHYPEEYSRAMAQNIVAAIMDTVGVLIDTESVKVTNDESQKKWLEFMAKFLLEANKKVPGIRSPEDFPPAVVDLMKWAAVELSDGAKNDWLEGAAQKTAEKTMSTLAKTFAGALLKWADIVGGVGQVAQRVSGMVQESAVETAFVVLGDPFVIEVVSVEPAAAKPGSELTITFRGRRTTGAFRIDQDRVWFEGPDIFEGKVLSVSGPTPDGTQRLVVLVPEGFGSSADGDYKVVVISRGWRGEGSFRLTSRPEVNEMTPASGFAATSTFSGTQVRLRGINFKATDDFLFSSAAGFIPAASKSGLEGDMIIRVPAGATTGPIKVGRRSVTPPDEVETEPFTVLGPPVIESFAPSHGPVGTQVSIRLQNAGNDPDVIGVFFTGKAESVPVTLHGSQSVVRVPQGADSGPVRVVTPAGQAEFAFVVDPGLARSGDIFVGGASVVSPERAGAFASGLAVPNDDDDFFIDSEGRMQPTDPPHEEGDFVAPDLRGSTPRFPVGSAFSDAIQITGTVTGNLGLETDYDWITGISGGKIVGNVFIAGNHCRIIGLEIEGTLTISGRENEVDVRITNSPGDGMVVTGSGNRVTANVSGTAGNGVVIDGNAEGNNFSVAVQGSGGHGVLFAGNARNNELRGSSVSNRLDGLVLDGSGVVGNIISRLHPFFSFQANFNGGNGVTISNGANANSFGYWEGNVSGIDGTETFVPIIADGNAGHGIVFAGAFPAEFWARCSGNAGHGVLFSGVAGGTPPLPLYVQTGANTNLGGNGLAGVRFEGGSRNLLLLGSMSRDRFGIQLEGPNVENIRLGNEVVRRKFFSAALASALYVRDTVSHGITLTNTSGHQIHVEDLMRCGGDGLVLYNSHSNSIRLSECVQNSGAGARLTENSAGNQFQSFKLPFLLANVRSNSVGIHLDRGARRNYLEGMDLISSRTHGLVMSGSGTVQNRIQRSALNGSGSEAILIEAGASDNFIGPEHRNLEPVRVQNHTNGIARITGRGTSNNLFHNVRTLLDATNAPGFIVENEASGNTFFQLVLFNLRDGIILRSGAFNNVVHGNLLHNFTGRGILVENASNNIIGSAVLADGNSLHGNRVNLEIAGADATGNWIANNRSTGAKETGVLLRDHASDNRLGPANSIQSSPVGIQLTSASRNVFIRNTVSFNTAAAVRLENGSAENDFLENTIIQNAGGIMLAGSTTLSNSIARNSITDNAGRGIRLSSGANRMLPPPRIREITGNIVSGEADAPDGSVVEIFQDTADEGQTLLASAPVTRRRFQAGVAVDPLQVGLLYRINATVTDVEGNTSEFSTPAGPEPMSFRAVFTTTRDGNQEIYLFDPTRTAPQRLTFHVAADYSASLNRTNVAWVSTRTNNSPEIFVTTLEGFPVQRLTTNGVPDYDPAWFPDNQRLAFVSERDGNPQIYIMNANGSGAVRLTGDAASDVQPNVSPDGSKIAFASNRDGNFEIYVIGTDGTGLQRLTQQPGADIHPAWSPDGEFIAFASERDGNFEIYVMKAGGVELRRLTANDAHDTHPTWLPQGNGVMFASDRSGTFELYVVAREGGPPTRLSFSAGGSAEPWASVR